MPRHSSVPAIVALLLVALIPQAGMAEPAGNDCLVKPNSAPPQGSHWYYRLDRAANRRCWFLGPDGLKVRQAEAPKRQLSAATPLNSNSEIRPEAAALESVPSISSSPSPSISQSDREARSLNNVAYEYTTGDSALNVGVAAAAEPPPEQVTAAAQASEVISTSMWPKQMLAAGAGALLLITVVLLLVYRPFGSFGRKLARNKSGQKVSTRGTFLRLLPAREIAADSQVDSFGGPLREPAPSPLLAGHLPSWASKRSCERFALAISRSQRQPEGTGDAPAPQPLAVRTYRASPPSRASIARTNAGTPPA